MGTHATYILFFDMVISMIMLLGCLNYWNNVVWDINESLDGVRVWYSFIIKNDTHFLTLIIIMTWPLGVK